jgi:hypothetical protein
MLGEVFCSFCFCSGAAFGRCRGGGNTMFYVFVVFGWVVMCLIVCYAVLE